VLTKYCVFTVNKELLIMRPYQIAATERILWKVKSSYNAQTWGTLEAGGYIWHTTGSGKTLTSFKAARLATSINYIDKVFFIVDRKDLDYQTMKEYQKFQKNSVNGSKDTKALKRAIESEDNKIIVTTIQKLSRFIERNPDHEIYKKQCVMIFDECHRSQFGDYQKSIKEKFKENYQFGFTGTPILEENATSDDVTTEKVFGNLLHSYVITHAIRDEKVLKFKVDYINTLAQYKDEEKVSMLDNELLHHKDRISAVTTHILKVFNEKTRRSKSYTHKNKSLNGFNAMFAVDKIDTAMMYYDEFLKQQSTLPEKEKITVATIFSTSPNEPSSYVGEIQDEDFTPTDLIPTKRDFLEKTIQDYNDKFKTNFSIEGQEFNNYYKDLSLRIKEREVDLVIVVGMFLTGFDAPTLNTLFVDKNLQYHGLLQAFSRTNRILNKVKPYGNIVCYRDLNNQVNEAIKLFADESGEKLILEKSFEEYMEGYEDLITGQNVIGFDQISRELFKRFSIPSNIILETDKIEFCKLFGQFLKLENKLKNYDEFQSLTEEQKIIPTALKQDMQSAYVTMREEFKKKKEENYSDDTYDQIEFQIELLRTDEINLEFILELILEKTKKSISLESILDEVKRTIRSNMDLREKEDLIINYLENYETDKSSSFEELIDSFYTYAKNKKFDSINKLITDERLKDNAKNFIERSISKGNVSNVGTELNEILPPLSRKSGEKEKKKSEVLEKIDKIIQEYKGI
ncbi:MAG: type I restriction endonuclease subunit R, partial [Anaerorhabdus sp.]